MSLNTSITKMTQMGDVLLGEQKSGLGQLGLYKSSFVRFVQLTSGRDNHSESLSDSRDGLVGLFWRLKSTVGSRRFLNIVMVVLSRFFIGSNGIIKLIGNGRFLCSLPVNYGDVSSADQTIASVGLIRAANTFKWLDGFTQAVLPASGHDISCLIGNSTITNTQSLSSLRFMSSGLLVELENLGETALVGKILNIGSFDNPVVNDGAIGSHLVSAGLSYLSNVTGVVLEAINETALVNFVEVCFNGTLLDLCIYKFVESGKVELI